MSVLKKLTVGQKSVLIILAIILVDQISKIWIKTHFSLYERIQVTNWFYIFFIENEGMAFGLKFINKLFLTLFRIVAVAGIGYLIHYFIKKKYPTGFIVCMSLIFAGALGNIIDCLFYGIIFSESTVGQVATFLPEGGGYAPLFYGKVVDMLHFPIIDTILPEWIPLLGGKNFVFFSPVFNFADTAITVGVLCLLIFYWKLLAEKEEDKKTAKQHEE